MTLRLFIRATLDSAGLIGAGSAAWPTDAPTPYPDFTFKREKPGAGSAGKRIRVQIDPEEQAALLAAPAPKPDADAGEGGEIGPIGALSWFWTTVRTGLEATPATRLNAAFAKLDDGPGGLSVSAPRLQTVQQIASENGADILRATIGSRVSPALVLAVISVESSGKPDGESHKGAQGLMQLMPDTAERFGVKDSLSASENIAGGVAYLDWLLKEFDGDAVLALAGYNAGEGAVKRHEGVPPYPETRDYVPKVLAAYQVASGLCKSRPELITDACALQLAMK